jgi:HPr kinase/phosphorylase
MEEKYSVKLSKIADEFELTKVYIPPNYEDINIVTSHINRPGMQLVGFFNHFSNERLQIMGIVESMYLKTLPANERRKCFEMLMKRNIPALIICANMEVFPECVEMAKNTRCPCSGPG